MNQPERRKVPEELRQGVLTALRNDDYFIYPDGRRYLREMGFNPPEFVVTDLIEYLTEGKPLYVLPENQAKCQCRINYEDNLIVYVKLSPIPQSDGYFVKLGFHSHNTGYTPIPD